MAAVSSQAPDFYRLAPHVQARFLGLAVVALAVVVFAGTAVVIMAGVDFAWMFLVVLAGLVAVFAFGWWLRTRAYVVRASAQGYRVAMVRGSGVKEARWADVQEAVTSSPHGAPFLELRLKKGGVTTIPVSIMEIDREEFVRRIQRYLATTIKPLETP